MKNIVVAVIFPEARFWTMILLQVPDESLHSPSGVIKESMSKKQKT